MFWKLLFGCRHERTTFPQSSKGDAKMHVVCVDCGKEFAYDWKRMRIGKELPRAVPVQDDWTIAATRKVPLHRKVFGARMIGLRSPVELWEQVAALQVAQCIKVALLPLYVNEELLALTA